MPSHPGQVGMALGSHPVSQGQVGNRPFFFFQEKKNKVEDSHFLTSKLRTICTNRDLTILSAKQEWVFL